MKGWKNVTLGEVCEFLDRRGVTPEKLGSQFRSDGFRVISAKNIKGREIDPTIGEQRFVDEPTYRRWMKSPLLADDVILTSEAPLGEPAYVEEELKWCLGQRLFGVRSDKSKLQGRFLFYAFQASPVRDDMLSRATGATAQGIRQSELTKVELHSPR
jgi:type I restriction enzyme S subunit